MIRLLLAALALLMPARVEVTAYACEQCQTLTASGTVPAGGRTLACPPSIPLGTHVALWGLGEFRCEDRGGLVRGRVFDMFVADSATARRFGRQQVWAVVSRGVTGDE